MNLTYFPSSSATRRRVRRRRGYGSLLFTMVLVVFIALLMLAVNYAYLAYSQLRTGDVTDTLARTAVSELLSEEVLEDKPAQQQLDLADAKVVVADYVQSLNQVAAPSQQLQADDLSVTMGYIDDVSQPGDYTELGNQLRNTLRVEASRPTNGTNPLYLLIRGLAFPQAANIGSASYATLDSRLIGFRPTAQANSPVVPIGIRVDAWQSGRSNLNWGVPARLDLDGRFRAADEDDNDPSLANLVMLDFNTLSPGAGSFDNTTIAAQLNGGIGVGDFSGDYLGPIAPTSSTPATQSFAADQSHPSNANDLIDLLNTIADSNEPRRIFPLYDNYDGNAGSARLVGFVAARVLHSEMLNMGGTNEQLRVILEPTFYVHFTAETAHDLNSQEVPENLYIHKLRLTR